ncbi:MAG: hypothetical protein JSW06_02460 [Thermoplasmatales archaeon]|nr:MAG: hypothetical protein JSW06_02460 [Thermoplasmatales archaeon]
MEAEKLFCGACGKQLLTINEIDLGYCNNCMTSKIELFKKGAFLCWSCGKKIATMNEIAQSVCQNCKAHIIRKLR